MDYNDQGYDNYGGSEKGGGSTSGRKAQRRLLWQSIVWAFLLTGELLLFGFWFWWGVGAHNDPYAPLFNVYPKFSQNGFVMSIAPAQICTKFDNTWKDSSVKWTCRTWLADESASVKNYFDDKYGPLVTSKVVTSNPSLQQRVLVASARVAVVSLEQANKFWPIRWVGGVLFVLPWIWLFVTVVVFLSDKDRKHRTKRPHIVKAGKGGGRIDVWFFMWFIPPVLLIVFWATATGLLNAITSLKNTIEADEYNNFYYNARFGPTFWIPWLGIPFSFVVLLAAFFSWKGYHKKLDK